MPHQLDLPFPKDEDEGFDSPYLDGRVALNLMEQLAFTANRQSLTLYVDPVSPMVHIEIGWSTELADPRDRDIFAQLVEDGGWPIERCGVDATIHMNKLVLTLCGAFKYPEEIGDRRPTIEDLYPSTRFGERGARGRLNPLMEMALGTFRPKDN